MLPQLDRRDKQQRYLLIKVGAIIFFEKASDFIFLNVGPGTHVKKLSSWKKWKFIFARSAAVFMAGFVFNTSPPKIEFAIDLYNCVKFFITNFEN